jgi:hypothetical protein
MECEKINIESAQIYPDNSHWHGCVGNHIRSAAKGIRSVKKSKRGQHHKPPGEDTGDAKESSENQICRNWYQS